MVRFRPVLRHAEYLPHVVHVLSFRPVRVAEPRTQGRPHLRIRPAAAAWPAVRTGHLSADAGRALSRLSRHGGGSERDGVLAALAGVAVLAERSSVVSVAA